MKKSDNPFLQDSWTEDSLQKTWNIVQKIAKTKYNLDYYEPRFEVVSYEDMLHIYCGSFPIMYDHWSFGKRYTQLYQQYRNNQSSIAYEVIFNTNPALCYLLENNSPAMQGLVIAHAAIGHSAFFKNNVKFKELSNANAAISFFKKFKNYVKECTEKYGQYSVDDILDSCHALSMYGIDRRPVISKTSKERETIKLTRELNKDKDYNKDTNTIDLKVNKTNITLKRMREENILKFIANNSPNLRPFERTLILLFCEMQQYFWPAMQTKMSNEGFASFWHHTIMNDMADSNILPPGSVLEFINSHCGVLHQSDYDSKYYSGINPYKLGFEIYKDIRRICLEPTEEDKEWFPGLIGKNWIEEIKYAAYNFNDESLVLQYLSPKLIRDLRLFSINNDESSEYIEISAIHDNEGYKEIRNKLSVQYSINRKIPDIFVEGWDPKKSRKLFLVFEETDGVQLDMKQADNVAEYLLHLWKFPIVFKYKHSNGDVEEAIIGGGE